MNTRFPPCLVVRLCLGLAGVWLAGSAFAQPQPGEPGPRAVSMSFVSFDRLPPGMQFEDQGKVVTPTIPGYGRSAPFQYTGGPPFVLFRQTTDANGRPVRVTLASVTYPPDWKKVLIVLFTAARAAPLHALAFDDGDEAFPAGRIRLFNFHPAPIAIASGGSVHQLAAGESRLVAMPSLDSFHRACLKLAILRGGGWEELPVWAMQARPTSRALVFAYERITQNGLQSLYLTIPETLPPKASTSPGGPAP